MTGQPYDKPSQVAPIEGDVSVRGPGAVGVSLTPDAARETAGGLRPWRWASSLPVRP